MIKKKDGDPDGDGCCFLFAFLWMVLFISGAFVMMAGIVSFNNANYTRWIYLSLAISAIIVLGVKLSGWWDVPAKDRDEVIAENERLEHELRLTGVWSEKHDTREHQ